MSHRFAFALLIVALALPGAASAQSESVQQIRRIFAPPVQTLKKVFKGETQVFSKPSPAKAPAAAPQPAPEPADNPADAGEAVVSAAGVPDPRPRPDHPSETAAAGEPATMDQPAATGESLEPDEAATTVVGLSEPGDFDKRFEPAAATGSGEMTFAPVPDAAPDSDADEAAVALGLVEMPLPKPRDAAAAAEALAGRTRLASLPPGGAEGSELDCERSLRSLGVVSVEVAPIKRGQCGIAAPTQVSALDGGSITLTAKATLTCRAAQTLATWMREQVEPAAQQQLRGNITGIRVAASYSCRTRNNVPGAKLSEHAHGNAIDISAFQVSGVGWVEVGKANTMGKRRFLAAVRKSACGPFTTVLGPGSDGYHEDHLHFDVIRRGKNGSSLYRH